MRKSYATIATSLFLVSLTLGQSGSISSGSTTFGWAGTAAANCSSVNHLNNFTASGTDHLYEHFWALWRRQRSDGVSALCTHAE